MTSLSIDSEMNCFEIDFNANFFESECLYPKNTSEKPPFPRCSPQRYLSLKLFWTHIVFKISNVSFLLFLLRKKNLISPLYPTNLIKKEAKENEACIVS